MQPSDAISISQGALKQRQREHEELASRLRVQEAHDRWVYWTRMVYEKAARVPVRQEIWDEDVIPLRQPVEECE